MFLLNDERGSKTTKGDERQRIVMARLATRLLSKENQTPWGGGYCSQSKFGQSSPESDPWGDPTGGPSQSDFGQSSDQ